MLTAMKLLTISLILGASLFGQSPSGDETAVRELIRRFVDARDHPDPRTLEPLFTADADQLVSNGQWRKGREEVVKGSIASSQNETGKRTITLESVRFPAPGVALADGRYELGDRKMWTSFVITRGSDGWRIAAIRNMLPAK
jgi:uncharacterized protein (TIGR02246 family)